MLVAYDAEWGVEEVPEDSRGEAPVERTIADELARDAQDAAAATGAAVELEADLEGVDGEGGSLRRGGRERGKGDLG